MSEGSLSWDAFALKFNIADLDGKLEAASLSRDGLQAIFQDYRSRLEELEDAAIPVVRSLERVKEVHSLRTRVKAPEHLVEKIIRKGSEDPSRVIDLGNYTTEITDLVGVRALHLLKSEWLRIDEFIKEKLETVGSPIAYYRVGDPSELISQFEERDCEALPHPRNYRSVHYLVSSKAGKTDYIVEVQVRTIFEEGWSEVDHRVRYPYGAAPALGQFLDLFNRLAGSADEMGTYVAILKDELDALEDERRQLTLELEDHIRRLGVTENEKGELQMRLDRVLAAGPSTSPDLPSLRSLPWATDPVRPAKDRRKLASYEEVLTGEVQAWDAENERGLITSGTGRFYVDRRTVVGQRELKPGEKVFFVRRDPFAEGKNPVAGCVTAVGSRLDGVVTSSGPRRKYCFVHVEDSLYNAYNIYLLLAAGDRGRVQDEMRVTFSVADSVQGPRATDPEFPV